MSASGVATTFYAGEAVVNFPDHTLLEYLDALSAVLGAPPLGDSLAAVVRVLKDNGGCAWVVAPGWVRAVAAADVGAATELAEAWSGRVGGGPATPELTGAVGDLIHLCRFAVREEVQVVYSWCI